MRSYTSASESQNQHKFPIEEEEEDLNEQQNRSIIHNSEGDEEEVILWRPKLRKKKTPHVCLEGYVEGSDDDALPRAKSLTDDDLDELKGCVDLGFGFSYDEIPELCNTLPALELCYSMSQKFLDDHSHHQSHGKGSGSGSDTASSAGSDTSSPVPTWKISSPGKLRSFQFFWNFVIWVCFPGCSMIWAWLDFV